MNLKKSFIGSWIICAVMLGTLEAASSDMKIRAITNPSADIILSFVQPGRITEVNIKEGQWVRAGQVLVQQDDSVEKIQLAQLKARSENTIQIEAREASLAQKRVDLKKLEKAATQKAATELEVEHAKLEVKVAELSLQLATFEHEQAKRKYNELKVQVEKMALKSPIDGNIEKIHVETGESVNALVDVVRVVKTDPLWIDVPVPLNKANTLRSGKTVQVRFPEPDRESFEGKIIYIAAVADAASGTLRVRIEVPNKSNRPAGEHIEVIFPAS
jgi:membrane fusion protein (multidrug efflux system)